jgi:predicted metalloprotease with PDZ domain
MASIGLSITVLIASVASANTSNKPNPDKVYQVLFEATLDPESGVAHGSLTLKQHRQLVRNIKFDMPAARYRNVHSSSQIERNDDRITWQPAKEGGTLQFDFVIDKQRANGEKDASITKTWALLKLDNLFPRATARVVKGATSQSTMKLLAPGGWAIETPYGQAVNQEINVSNPHRLFDRPLGWLLAGELGIRRDRVDKRHISVASPLGSGLQANVILAFLRWTLPSMIDVFPDFPPRLLIVSGSEDMWRGGLSGVGSLYLHSDRPLISGNRTSPMLHELFHVASRLHGKDGADWIIEGLAEYYSLTLLLRSGGISEYRYRNAFAALARWSEAQECIATDQSQGKQTAYAALIMQALDSEIRAKTNNKESLDTLVQVLVHENQTVTNASFRDAATELLKGPVDTLSDCP